MSHSDSTLLDTSNRYEFCTDAPDPRFQMRKLLESGHRSLHAKIPFPAGSVLCPFGVEEEVETPNFLSVQIDRARHIMLSPNHLELINHSCEPNVFFDTTTMELKALRDISEGDELFFFYPSTEWNMDQPFKCHCRTGSCLEHIRGAAHLPREIVGKYRVNAHIEKLVDDAMARN